MGRLQGKRAIVTGAARGQGEATARLFAAEGAKVVIADVLEDEGRTLAAELGDAALFIRLDISSEEGWAAAVAQTLDRFGGIEVLINNGAVTYYNGILKTPKADLERILAINAMGPYLGMKAVLPTMIAARRGSIVNISSVNGLRGTYGMSAYDAAKWAVRGMTKSVALEMAQHGIRVNSVHPGAIDTPMLNPNDDDMQALAQELVIPFRRVGRPAEVAAASLFLASDEAAYVSGAELAVDGAWTSGLMTNVQELEAEA
jgi:3alpha(or 20beta)-hydroxysteroid dehydrogenase